MTVEWQPFAAGTGVDVSGPFGSSAGGQLAMHDIGRLARVDRREQHLYATVEAHAPQPDSGGDGNARGRSASAPTRHNPRFAMASG